MSNYVVISNEPIHNRDYYSCEGEHGPYIKFTNDFSAGFSFIKKLKPDIIFTDWMVGDSPALIFKEKCIRWGSSAKFIFMISGEDIPVLDEGDITLDYSDYMYQPVSLQDILHRIQNKKCRRSKLQRINDLEIDFSEKQVYIDGVNCKLTTQEFDLLTYLIKNKERACSREELAEYLFCGDATKDSRSIDSYIKRIRDKIEPGRVSAFHNKYIFTIRGAGYKFLSVE